MAAIQYMQFATYEPTEQLCDLNTQNPRTFKNLRKSFHFWFKDLAQRKKTGTKGAYQIGPVDRSAVGKQEARLKRKLSRAADSGLSCLDHSGQSGFEL
jgi:hypothetical protein